ncbi:sensor histidine kinase [Stutzerimonas nitrititolerans]|uniref:sensor histidine kinase n=3 Tax=Stutzerimonas nitrititolerans TaxID=2482751 RepID=UPI0007189B99|nr:ATP-binding protein [Stutzerimonas nitrititolerans]KRW74191.1 histidine kinase [Pseudomonas sp. TTU2014-096BSC]HJE29162.1 PAS domain-containing protein [Stutzerimonas nitrititolerans]
MGTESLALPGSQGQRILRVYHLYRIAIGLALVLLISSDLHDDLMRMRSPALFHYGAWLYLILNTLIAVLAYKPRQGLPILSLALMDVILLSALFYFAGGTPSGIGNLLIIAVAIANILLHGRIGLLIAAIAAIGLIYLTFYLSLGDPDASRQYPQAAALGTLCFAAALLVQGLSRRLRVSEELARQRAEEVANLEALNALILQRMRTGILVLDSRQRVLLANQGALELLGQESLVGERLAPRCPELLKAMQRWRDNPTLRPQNLKATADGPVLQPSFAALQNGAEQNVLVFLEDISQIAQKAQQLKLASLGRLTASIAHEIRNPLGAISHAAQLLQESDSLDQSDQRLAQIIQDHSRRMNLVIENVLQLSRRRQAEPQLLDLKYWLHRFASEFRGGLAPNQTLHLETIGSSLQTRMDPNQLIQVLTNLVQNGLRYSGQTHEQAQVWLRLFRDTASDLPVVEVIDDGPGVPVEQEQLVFEPFFTTENKGTGLGLYISRELCESNRAWLDYRKRDEQSGSCFRITFAHPRKRAE